MTRPPPAPALPLRASPSPPLRRAALAALAPFATLPAAGRPAAAQPATVDEGTFTVTRGGVRVGREEFRIVRQPGAGFVARGAAAYGDRRVTPALVVGADGAPERYQVEVRRGAALEQRVSAQAAGTHFRAQTVSDQGEAAREFLIDPGTAVVDDQLFHQYYFALLRAPDGGAAGGVVLLAPQRGAQVPVAVRLAGDERVAIGAESVAARHYVLTPRAGGARRDVWTDAQGRVLRVVLGDDGTVAQRDDVPR